MVMTTTMEQRVILHSDLNCFYASVETMLNPSLRGKAVAVCGSTESRHGIVLAKSELAKKRGVKTGMVNWEARQCCPDIIMDKRRHYAVPGCRSPPSFLVFTPRTPKTKKR